MVFLAKQSTKAITGDKITMVITTKQVPKNYSSMEQFFGILFSVILTTFALKIICMAYEKKIPVDLDCPLRLTMSLIESKWKSCILDELRSGTAMRPSEIHKCLPEAAPRVLDIQLKEMVEDGLVIKTIYPELPPRSEYQITELGKSLLPIIDQMLRWGEEHFDIFEKKYGRQ